MTRWIFSLYVCSSVMMVIMLLTAVPTVDGQMRLRSRNTTNKTPGQSASLYDRWEMDGELLRENNNTPRPMKCQNLSCRTSCMLSACKKGRCDLTSDKCKCSQCNNNNQQRIQL